MSSRSFPSLSSWAFKKLRFECDQNIYFLSFLVPYFVWNHMASAIISVVLVAFFRLRIRGSGPILERTNFFPVQPVYTEPCKFLLQTAALLAVQQLVLFFRVPCKRKVIRASSCLFRQNFVRTRVNGVLR